MLNRHKRTLVAAAMLRNVGANIQGKQMSNFLTAQSLQKQRRSPFVVCMCVTNGMLCVWTRLCFFKVYMWICSFYCIRQRVFIYVFAVCLCCRPCLCLYVIFIGQVYCMLYTFHNHHEQSNELICAARCSQYICRGCWGCWATTVTQWFLGKIHFTTQLV